MTRDDVIRMAKVAHVVPYIVGPQNTEYLDRLERFAALVAAHEREECAKVCDTTPVYPFRPSIEAAYAIRARGTHEA